VEKLYLLLLAFLGIIVALFLFACVRGTVVWILWDLVMTDLGLPSLKWHQCVALAWICLLLFTEMSKNED
jgi:hypothetical protein